MESHLQKHSEKKQKNKEKKEQQKQLYEEQCKKLKLEREDRELELNTLWACISKKQQLWVCDRLKDYINKIKQEDNAFAIAKTDLMEAELKRKGDKIVRENLNELRVNGILIRNSYIEKMVTLDEVVALMPSRLSFYNNAVADIEMIMQRNFLKNNKILFVEGTGSL